MAQPRISNLSLILGALALVAGALLWLQRQSTESLRIEMVLLKEQNAELAKARAENARLKAAAIPEEELVRLRADRAALLRLRGEFEHSRKDVERQEKALKKLEADAAVTVRMGLSMSLDRGVLLDGEPFDETKLRQKLAGLPRGTRFDLNLVSPASVTEEHLQGMRKTLEEIRGVARSLGLGFQLESVDLTTPAK